MIRKSTEHAITVAQLWSVLSVVVILISSCSRYEENSGISFRRAHKIILDDWMLDTLEGIPFAGYSFIDTLANDTFTIFNGQKELLTLEDGSFLRLRIMETLADNGVGSWLMTSDKKHIEFNHGSGIKRRFNITKLNMDNLWLREGDSLVWKYSRHVVDFD